MAQELLIKKALAMNVTIKREEKELDEKRAGFFAY